MAFIELIPEDRAERALKRVYDAAKHRAGRIANIIRLMSRDGRVVQGSMAFYVPLMKADNALSAARREMLATVVSNINDCYY